MRAAFSKVRGPDQRPLSPSYDNERGRASALPRLGNLVIPLMQKAPSPFSHDVHHPILALTLEISGALVWE
jgi:hypothetical protein